MTRMGDVLAGIHSSWEFDTDSVLIRFERGIRTPKLFHVLGERRIPHEALSSVELGPGARKGTVVLRILPRPGADPLLEAAAGQLREAADPYRLVLPAERETPAGYYAAELLSRLGPRAREEADEFMVDPPPAPLRFKAYDGRVAFDGATVDFRWFRTGASSAKWKAGDQTFAVAELAGVEWRSPELEGGYLRLLRRGPDGKPLSPAPLPADQDPTAVVFGLGYGLVHESLPLAASVLAAVQEVERTGGPVSALPNPRDPRRDPADIADRIRHLGELHSAGLLTDEEFSLKKQDLLAEL
ncbi:DUF4429 domain-containing protein [Streptomyces calidiresistens]|uniref:DUF4429 domain-containing protein n=2 Tax=Streptomyces calidiresistens TaxID=1485586 RepID=A0A7W3T0S0_9ACTN|nr:DUF4429 domain-containing protein [Streptomyces calidiresistens]